MKSSKKRRKQQTADGNIAAVAAAALDVAKTGGDADVAVANTNGDVATGGGVLPPVSSSLARTQNEDPFVMTNLFESSKIKKFMYKEEPNMPKINAASLELISTTFALLLKSVVDKAVLLEQSDDKSSSSSNSSLQQRKKINAGNAVPKGTPASNANTNEDVLITSNYLKRAVLSCSSGNPPSLDFLVETYENFRDKDASILPSRLYEYVPRTTAKRTKRKEVPLAEVPAVAAAAAVEKPKTTISGRSSKTIDSSSFGTCEMNDADAVPLEKAIADASATTNERNLIIDEIVEDDDDYD